MLTYKNIKELYAKLSIKLPEEAEERTKASQTGRGYDTTGYKYQFIVNHLNDVLGLGGHKTEHSVEIVEEVTKNGRKRYDAVCKLKMTVTAWIELEGGGTTKVHIGDAESYGGHSSFAKADALKGAYTNAFKKAAAMFGVGKHAYEGTVDDDNQPTPDAVDIVESPKTRPSAANAKPTADNELVNKIKSASTLQELTKLLPELNSAPEAVKADLRKAYATKKNSFSNGASSQVAA